MKSREVICLFMVALMLICTLAITAAAADIEYPIGYWNIVYANRYLTFATDGGSFIKTLELPRGAVVNVNDYIPTKDGYIFDGWYSDPRSKTERVNEIILTENIVVYAKWLDDGTPRPELEAPDIATRDELLAYGDYTDKETGAPVTALWVEQHTRLEALMKQYNEKFNK